MVYPNFNSLIAVDANIRYGCMEMKAKCGYKNYVY